MGNRPCFGTFGTFFATGGVIPMPKTHGIFKNFDATSSNRNLEPKHTASTLSRCQSSEMGELK